MSETNVQTDRIAFLKTHGFIAIEIEVETRILEVLHDLQAQNDAMIHAYQLFIEKSPKDPSREYFKANYDRAIQDNARIAALLKSTS